MAVNSARATDESRHEVGIHVGPVNLEGELIVPAVATGLVLFAHGSGSLALYGMKRRGVFGAVVSGVGTRMLRRGLPDFSSHRRGGP